MTIFTALWKLRSLSKDQLKHCIQRMDIEIVNYERVAANYPPERMRRFGIPNQQRLKARRQQFVDRLSLLTKQ